MAIVIQKLEEMLNNKKLHGGKGRDEDNQVRFWQLFDLVAGM